MKRTRHRPEQIITKLRDADGMLAAGRTIGEVCAAETDVLGQQQESSVAFRATLSVRQIVLPIPQIFTPFSRKSALFRILCWFALVGLAIMSDYGPTREKEADPSIAGSAK